MGTTCARSGCRHGDTPPGDDAGPASDIRVAAYAIRVDTRPAEPIDLVVRVDDHVEAGGDQQGLTGRARVRRGGAVVLILPLKSTDALPMGMRMGPPPDAPRLDTAVRVMG